MSDFKDEFSVYSVLSLSSNVFLFFVNGEWDRGKAAVGKALGVQAEKEGNRRRDLASALCEPAGIHPHQQAHHVNQPSLSGEDILSPN